MALHTISVVPATGAGSKAAHDAAEAEAIAAKTKLDFFVSKIKEEVAQGQGLVEVGSQSEDPYPLPEGVNIFTKAGYYYAYNSGLAKVTINWSAPSTIAEDNVLEYTAARAYADANKVIDGANAEVSNNIMAAALQNNVAVGEVTGYTNDDGIVTAFFASKADVDLITTPYIGMKVTFEINSTTIERTITAIEVDSDEDPDAYLFTVNQSFDLGEDEMNTTVTLHNAIPGYQVSYAKVPTKLVAGFEAALDSAGYDNDPDRTRKIWQLSIPSN